ncbi:MAG TPA: dehydrogenase, partial [Sphaerochaeta sp.]|nr:dehydrogenase [Sphaerochaeta sp.]
MSRTLPFDPKQLREKQTIAIPSIPVNQYQSDFKKELKLYGKERLIRAYYDMLLIRKFETMLDTIKKEGVYQGIKYTHKGPAHLSAGQESAAVGQSMVLDPEDQIFGSHRSHGEILAKSLSAIWKMDEKALLSVMEDFMDGETYKVVANHFAGKDTRDLAENFVLYGALAEIFAKKTGFSAGLGGSMHTFFKPFGSMPNNAIVGGSATIAVGASLYKKINRKKGIVIANIGDGSLARGPVWEGLVLSSMDQYKTLWDDNPGYPPFLLNC